MAAAQRLLAAHASGGGYERVGKWFDGGVARLLARALDDPRLRAAAVEVGAELRGRGGLDAAARLILETAAGTC